MPNNYIDNLIKTEEIIIESKDLNNWSYRGEGNANLVISCPEQKNILRFAKSKYEDKDHDIDEIAHFTNEVMRPLVGHQFVRPVNIGVISQIDFEKVKHNVQQYRPLKRCNKNIKSTRVIISPDCVFLTPKYDINTCGDTFSIEIKPKQGWHSPKATCSVDLCHRCLKQYAKVYCGEIDCVSSYCPLDLFSGDILRMKRAIYDLYDSPHNRFKIFKNGKIIYTETTNKPPPPTNVSFEKMNKELTGFLGIRDEIKVKDYLSSLLIGALLDKESANDYIDLDPVTLPKSKACDTSSQPLPSSCILNKILSIQKHTALSDHDAKFLCEKLLNNMDNSEVLNQLVLWYNPATSQLNPSDDEAVRQLRRFLLSVTAKDISLLLTFREIKDQSIIDDKPTINLRDKKYRVMISVIDLDPKPVHRITNWVERKEEWFKIYTDSLNKRFTFL